MVRFTLRGQKHVTALYGVKLSRLTKLHLSAGGRAELDVSTAGWHEAASVLGDLRSDGRMALARGYEAVLAGSRTSTITHTYAHLHPRHRR